MALRFRFTSDFFRTPPANRVTESYYGSFFFLLSASPWAWILIDRILHIFTYSSGKYGSSTAFSIRRPSAEVPYCQLPKSEEQIESMPNFTSVSLFRKIRTFLYTSWAFGSYLLLLVCFIIRFGVRTLSATCSFMPSLRERVIWIRGLYPHPWLACDLQTVLYLNVSFTQKPINASSPVVDLCHPSIQVNSPTYFLSVDYSEASSGNSAHACPSHLDSVVHFLCVHRRLLQRSTLYGNGCTADALCNAVLMGSCN